MGARILLTLTAATMIVSATAQPRYNYDKLRQEKLDRGLVAIPISDNSVAVTWRTLRSDEKGHAFHLYKNGKQLTPKPLTSGGTYYVDQHPRTEKAVYELRDMTDRKESAASATYTLQPNAPIGYLPIPIQQPDGGTTPDGQHYTYSANDASVGDVDGDGQYEIFLKWEPSNARDNSHGGHTGPTLIDCYRLSGERLWRINLGQNIRSGAHYVQFVVMDFDGDGCAEMMVKTADGTTDGQGHAIGDAKACWVEMGDTAAQRRQRQEMEQRRAEGRPQRGRRGRWGGSQDQMAGRILKGPEYLTVFNGKTGAAMATADYLPERGEPRAWGDAYGNRSERYLAGAAYLDGLHPSAIFCRGYYTRTVIAAWDWDGQRLKSRWVFDTNVPQWNAYAGQGNHNLRVADVDGDGKDEITYGSMAVDDDGTGLYTTGFGHGDAIHLMAFSPDSDELQVWDCHENKRDGSDFRNARTGEVIFQIKSKTDVGRCMAADIDPTSPGVEMWSTDSHGIRDTHGNLVKRGNGSDEDNTKLVIKGKYLPVNFGIWWDGDLLRELLDHETVYKYNWEAVSVDVVQRFEGVTFNNGTKSNPCLQADLLGDWREEVLVRTRDNSELRLYVTPHPTPHRITCLMQDVPYRLSVAAENVAYNQPPEPGFYLGAERTDYGK